MSPPPRYQKRCCRRPILSENCWRCHGFDAHAYQSDLRPDIRQNALAAGVAAVVPHGPDKSKHIARITSLDENLRMPPGEAYQRMSEQQIPTLKTTDQKRSQISDAWVFRASHQTHVAEFENPIDAFVAAPLKQHHLEFAPEVIPTMQLQRVRLDLTSLPSTIEDIEQQ